MTDTISDLLTQLEAPGTFATRRSAPVGDLAVEVTGVGRLRFPITPSLAKKLRAVARPSPFGLREQTLHDLSVRNTWEIAASRVKIAQRSWKPALAAHLQTLREDLGLPAECELKPVFDKLLLYEKGQFFKPHQDSEKRDDMVATLVVVLPSEYSGGDLTVEQRGETKRFKRLARQAKELSLLAFYADCHHAVSPIKSGVRVALTYQLLLEGGSKPARPKLRADVVDSLTQAVRAHFAVPVVKRYQEAAAAPPERLVYLLDHEYTQRGLAWGQLKNGDRVRAAALRTVAERLDCECFLALAEVHETWSCVEDYYGGGYRRHGWRSEEQEEEEEEESDDYELLDLHDSEIELQHWRDAEGNPIDGVPGSVSGEELHFTKPSSELDPFKSEHQGYQGNYGGTVDRWYHRAAFVMWPKQNTFALRAQASPQWAVDELLKLPRTDTAELESLVKALLPRWRGTAASVEGVRFFTKLLKLSTRIDDAALAHAWLLPLGVHRLQSRAMRGDLVALVDKHGFPWAKKLFTDWMQNRSWGTPAWAPVLADLCQDLCASERAPCEALAHWLIEGEVKVARERCIAARQERQSWLDLDAFAGESTHLAHVLAAAAGVSATQVLEDFTRFLLDEKRGFPLPLFVHLLAACRARSPALRAHFTGSALHRACAEQLRAVLQAPARAVDDWAIKYELGCACADCKQLSTFLRSQRTDLDWPLNKDRRQHIHHAIDRAKLPVAHTTLRVGRPQVLQLRKERSLFERERAYRARVKEMLGALPAIRSR